MDKTCLTLVLFGLVQHINYEKYFAFFFQKYFNGGFRTSTGITQGKGRLFLFKYQLNEKMLGNCRSSTKFKGQENSIPSQQESNYHFQ